VLLKTFGECLQGRRVRVFCDNMAAVCLINKGKSSYRLTQVLKKVHLQMVKHDVHIEAVHIPGEQNVMADALSRGMWEVFWPAWKQFGVQCRMPKSGVVGQSVAQHSAAAIS
jgi:hypothetical protein